MNSEPVAWARQDGVIAFHAQKEVDSQGYKWFPLFTHPVKYCPSENNEAYEKGFIDGMAKQRDSKVQQMVEGYTHPVKELTDEEIMEVATINLGHSMGLLNWMGFARAILRKASEK
jgi:hypothetical protein